MMTEEQKARNPRDIERKNFVSGRKGKDNRKRKQNEGYSQWKTQKLSRNIIVGDHCNWLNFDTIRSRRASCEDGTKMVIKNR